MSNTSYIIDGKEAKPKGKATLSWINDKYFSVDFLGKVFNGEIVNENIEDQTITVKINHRSFEITKKRPLDDLIKELGLDKKKVKKLHQLQSPMPGRVLSYAVEIGSEVTEGTPLLTLEAMKMENVIKAEGEGVVKSIIAQNDAVVEKGALLIEFE